MPHITTAQSASRCAYSRGRGRHRWAQFRRVALTLAITYFRFCRSSEYIQANPFICLTSALSKRKIRSTSRGGVRINCSYLGSIHSAFAPVALIPVSYGPTAERTQPELKEPRLVERRSALRVSSQRRLRMHARWFGAALWRHDNICRHLRRRCVQEH